MASLKLWTGKAKATIIYDSTVDEFTDQGLFNRVKGKENIAIIGFTTDGDVFGGFYNVSVTQQNELFKDPDMFVFSFESHGRCETPQRFAVKGDAMDEAGVVFYKNHFSGFVWFYVGVGGVFSLGNEGSRSYCDDLSKGFLALQDTTLTGKSGYRDEDEHHCTRLVALHLS